MQKIWFFTKFVFILKKNYKFLRALNLKLFFANTL